jgi:CDP-4-dehydro-6-deoxyglucose reductase
MPLPPTFEARLVNARMISRSVRELTLERTDGAPLVFDAGQWVNIVLPLESGEVRRAYSIASAPAGTARFEIAVTKVEHGPGSTFLHALEPGATLRTLGPQGFFTRAKTRGAPSLFIATGTGVTPLRSMLHAAMAEGEQAPLWLLCGVRREDDMLYRDELDALRSAHPHVHAEYTLSQPPPGWAHRRGYVQAHVRELWDKMEALGEGKPHAYVCGLQRMVGSVRDLLRKEMNVPREHVHTERYD